MRLYQIICEATPGQILKRNGIPEKLEQTWLQRYNEEVSATDIMNKLISLAPTGNVNTYIEWLTKLFLNDSSFDINDGELKSVISAHNNNRHHMEIKDPLQYQSYQQMLDDIENYQEQSGKSTLSRTKKREGERSGVSGEGVKTIIPGKMYQLDQKAAEKYGADTWCISAPGTPEQERNGEAAENRASMFDRYSDGAKPFFMLTLPEMRPEYSKIGIFPDAGSEEAQFQDRMNNKINSEEINEIWSSYPDIYEKIRPYITYPDFVKDEEKMDMYAKNPDVFETDEGTNEFSDFLNRNKDKNLKRNLDVEDEIYDKPYLSVDYADSVIKGRWPEAEEALLRQPHWGVQYAARCLKERWPALEDKLLDAFSPVASYYYAKAFFPNGWPEYERDVLKYLPAYIHNKSYGVEAILRYIQDVTKGRWPEIEPMLKGTKFWDDYVSIVNK